MFCKKCGSLLIPGDRGMICSQCGHSEGGEVTLKNKSRKSEKIDVVGSKQSKEVLPETQQECEKCGHNLAYFWTVQTRSADEPETVFYKCTKCNYTWRSYD